MNLINFFKKKKKNYLDYVIKAENNKFNTPFGPEYVTVDITNKCNLNCIGCWTYSPLLEKKDQPKNSQYN